MSASGSGSASDSGVGGKSKRGLRLSSKDVQHLYHAIHDEITRTSAEQYPLQLLKDDGPLEVVPETELVWRRVKDTTVAFKDVFAHTDGHFAIVKRLGKGAYGTVYKIDLTLAGESEPFTFAMKTELIEDYDRGFVGVHEKDGHVLKIASTWCLESITLYLQHKKGLHNFVPRVYATLLLNAPDNSKVTRCLCTIMTYFDPARYVQLVTWNPRDVYLGDIFMRKMMEYYDKVWYKLDMRNFDMHDHNILVDTETGHPIIIDTAMVVFTDPDSRITYMFGYIDTSLWQPAAEASVRMAVYPDASNFWLRGAMYPTGIATKLRKLQCDPGLIDSLDKYAKYMRYGTPTDDMAYGGEGDYEMQVVLKPGMGVVGTQVMRAPTFNQLVDKAIWRAKRGDVKHFEDVTFGVRWAPCEIAYNWEPASAPIVQNRLGLVLQTDPPNVDIACATSIDPDKAQPAPARPVVSLMDAVLGNHRGSPGL